MSLNLISAVGENYVTIAYRYSKRIRFLVQGAAFHITLVIGYGGE